MTATQHTPEAGRLKVHHQHHKPPKASIYLVSNSARSFPSWGLKQGWFSYTLKGLSDLPEEVTQLLLVASCLLSYRSSLSNFNKDRKTPRTLRGLTNSPAWTSKPSPVTRHLCSEHHRPKVQTQMNKPHITLHPPSSPPHLMPQGQHASGKVMQCGQIEAAITPCPFLSYICWFTSIPPFSFSPPPTVLPLLCQNRSWSKRQNLCHSGFPPTHTRQSKAYHLHFLKKSYYCQLFYYSFNDALVFILLLWDKGRL